MVQLYPLEKYQIKTYTTFIKFFRETIGIKEIREEIPQHEILEELNLAYSNFNEIGKGIIAKHALLSFIPEFLRTNSLIQLYIYKKLLKGNSPLSKRSIIALFKYYEEDAKLLKEDISNHSKLATAMLSGMKLLLPDRNLDFYFDNYLKLLIAWKDSILEDDYIFLDAIIDDFWIAHNWTTPTPDEITMIIAMAQLFDGLKKPYSQSFFQKYVQDNRDKLIRKFNKQYWLVDKDHLRDNWSKFANQGINFFYGVNMHILGLKPLFFILQLHPKINTSLFQFSLRSIGNVSYIFENWSQSSCVFFGAMHIPTQNMDYVDEFFSRLKDMGTLIDYILVPSSKAIESMSNQFVEYKQQLYIDSTKKLEDEEKYRQKMDIVDSILLFHLTTMAFMGYPLDDITKFTPLVSSQIQNHIMELEKRTSSLLNLEELLKYPASWLKIITPKCFLTEDVSTLKEYITSSNLTLWENLYFYEKWHQILSQIQSSIGKSGLLNFTSLKTQNPTLFVTLLGQIQKIKQFVSSCYKNIDPKKVKQVYSTKSILNSIIAESDDEISGLISDLSTLVFYLNSRLRKNYYNLDVVHDQLNILRNLVNLSETELLHEFQARLEKYIKWELILPNLTHSLTLQIEDYLESWLFPDTFPSTLRDLLASKFRSFRVSIYNNQKKSWEMDYGYNFPSKKKDQWRIFQKVNFPVISFIQVPYDKFFHFDKLYDFENQDFISLKPRMKTILEFCSKHLSTSHVNQFDTLSDYIKIERYTQLNKKQLESLEQKKHAHNNIPSDFMNMERIFHSARVKDTTHFLTKENTSVIDIRIEVNWPKFGMEEYIVHFKIQSEQFSHKTLRNPITTREFLCIPGINQIYSTTNSGYFGNWCIHYLFPFNSPAYNVFNSLERWGYIRDLLIIKIKSKRVWFNSKFLEEKSTKFHTWDLIAHRIITDTIKEDEYSPLIYEYSPGQNILGPSSYQYQTIQKIYGKNIRKLSNLPVYENILKLFHANLIWLIPDLEKLHSLPHRVLLLLYPVKSEDQKIFIKLIMSVPLSIVYVVEYGSDKKAVEGIFADLRFHPCNLSEFLVVFRKVVEYYKVENFRVIPSIIPITKQEFIGKRLNSYPNLLNSFIWEKNQYKNIKYFTKAGPLSLSDRYKQY